METSLRSGLFVLLFLLGSFPSFSQITKGFIYKTGNEAKVTINLVLKKKVDGKEVSHINPTVLNYSDADEGTAELVVQFVNLAPTNDKNNHAKNLYLRVLKRDVEDPKGNFDCVDGATVKADGNTYVAKLRLKDNAPGGQGVVNVCFTVFYSDKKVNPTCNEYTRADFNYSVTLPSARMNKPPTAGTQQAVSQAEQLWQQAHGSTTSTDKEPWLTFLGYCENNQGSCPEDRMTQSRNQLKIIYEKLYSQVLTRVKNEEVIAGLEDFIQKNPESQLYGAWVDKAEQEIEKRKKGAAPSAMTNKASKENLEECETEFLKLGKTQSVRKYSNYLKKYCRSSSNPDCPNNCKDAQERVNGWRSIENTQNSILQQKLDDAQDDDCAKYNVYLQYYKSNLRYDFDMVATAKKEMDKLEEKNACKDFFNLIEAQVSSTDEGMVEIHLRSSEKITDLEALDFRLSSTGRDQEVPRPENYKVSFKDEGSDDYRIFFEELEAGVYSFSVKNPKGDQESIEFYVEPRTEEFVLETINGKLTARIRGSRPPFVIQVKKNESWSSLKNLKDQHLRFYPDFTAALKNELEPGTYEFRVQTQGQGYRTFGEVTASIGTNSGGWFWWMIGLAMVVVFVLLYSINKRKIDQVIRRKPWLSFLFSREYAPEKTVAPSIEELATLSAEMEQPGKDGFQIKIKNRPLEEEGESIAGFMAISEAGRWDGQIPLSDEYYRVDLSDTWPDTAVEELFIHSAFAATINLEVQGSCDRMDKEGRVHPEIGGFLLGQFGRIEFSDAFRVTLDQYVPVKPEKNGAYEIEFGDEAQDELEKARDRFPNLKLVGWFHTHPGHGLFLSRPDQKIQRDWFRKPYHIAMEVETLTPNFDMAFFTWKKDGRLNEGPKDRHEHKKSWDCLQDVTTWRRTLGIRRLE